MDEGILVPIVLFLVIGGTISVSEYLKYRRRNDLQETIRTAIEKGQELPAEVLETISRPKPPPRKDQDLRRGVMLIALGVGIGAFGYFIGDDDAMGPLMGIGTIPLLIGLALTVLWILRTRHDN